MNEPLKRIITQLYDICDPNSGDLRNDKETITLERARLKTEFMDYVLYLSASDGMSAGYECDFLKDYFGITLTPEEVRKYITTNNIYTSQFEQIVPISLMNCIERDNMFYRKNGSLDASHGKAFLDVFECVGKEFLVCDGEASESEVSDFTIYTRMLRKYFNENYTGPATVKSAVYIDDVRAGEVIPRFNKKGEKESTLDELLYELNNLVGLDVVKKDVNSLIHLQEIKRIRKERGLKEIPVSNHLVFYGNPGTGKTTVARLLAKIYHAMGILSTGEFVEADRSSLVAGYVGQTAIKVQDVVKKAMGGVLFIDEAYTLSYATNGNDYGQEAIDTLLKLMEDNREDLIVIVAGYPELMGKFIDSNPGLRSRFNKYINFEDYNEAELLQIYKVMCENTGYRSTADALDYVASYFTEKYRNRGDNFANAREVRNFFEAAVVKQADRLYGNVNVSDEELCTLELEDVQGI